MKRPGRHPQRLLRSGHGHGCGRRPADDWLEAHGLREDTLIIFSGDNGMNMGHHGIYGKGNGTFPMNMFDTSVKVPVLISRPAPCRRAS